MDKWIIIANGGYSAYWSANFPQNIVARIKKIVLDPNTISNNDHGLVDIAFTRSNGWALLYYPSESELCLV